jgi:hypothetical protein
MNWTKNSVSPRLNKIAEKYVPGFRAGASEGDVFFDRPQDEYLIISLYMLYYLRTSPITLS